jgi:formylglycine-generating enzyme required for sulfatase activity
LRLGFAGELIPSGLFTVESGFEHYPISVSWITSVALAAAKTEADARFLVRLMRENEYNDLLRYVYGDDMPEEGIKAMSVFSSIRMVARANSVVGAEANRRTRRGITDAFGNMSNWLDDLSDATRLTHEDGQLLQLQRIVRGVGWNKNSEDARVTFRGNLHPWIFGPGDGVRLVAVPRR